MKAIAYELQDGVNRVEIAHGDSAIVVEGRYETKDVLEQAALDANPHVKRAAARSARAQEAHDETEA